jgi:hypothetical protein
MSATNASSIDISTRDLTLETWVGQIMPLFFVVGGFAP